MKRPHKKATVRRTVEPKNDYVSTCCNELATKTPLTASDDAEGSLGKFRCGKCGKRSKVNRHVRKSE